MRWVSAQEANPAGRGWYRLKSGTCERVKPCPVGTFRINNSDTLYEICGGSGRTIHFRKAVKA